jgi:hypothetical protein
MAVPHTVHTIWIQDPSSNRTFGIGEWLSILSLLKNTDYRVLLHTNLAPGQSEYDPYRISHDRFLINQCDFNLTWNGVRMRAANLSDIERIRILYENGGIYADLDIWWKQPVELPTSHTLITAYENPSYKTVANAFIVAREIGSSVLQEILRQMESRFINLRNRGITDLTANPAEGLSPHHTLLWKLTGDIFKQNGANILGKAPFYKNGWRRIGRELRRIGVEFKPSVVPSQLGNTADHVTLDGISGFHYYAALFTPEQVLRIPIVSDTFQPVLDWGHQWLG